MTDANCEGFTICDDRITENDQCFIKIIGMHCTSLTSHAPGGGAGVKILDFEILTDFDFVAAGGIRVSQTHV